MNTHCRILRIVLRRSRWLKAGDVIRKLQPMVSEFDTREALWALLASGQLRLTNTRTLQIGTGNPREQLKQQFKEWAAKMVKKKNWPPQTGEGFREGDK